MRDLSPCCISFFPGLLSFSSDSYTLVFLIPKFKPAPLKKKKKKITCLHLYFWSSAYLDFSISTSYLYFKVLMSKNQIKLTNLLSLFIFLATVPLLITRGNIMESSFHILYLTGEVISFFFFHSVAA